MADGGHMSLAASDGARMDERPTMGDADHALVALAAAYVMQDIRRAEDDRAALDRLAKWGEHRLKIGRDRKSTDLTFHDQIADAAVQMSAAFKPDAKHPYGGDYAPLERSLRHLLQRHFLRRAEAHAAAFREGRS